MADYPCDGHLARYQGPSTRAYLNLYRDNDQVKLRLSLCEPCLDQVLEVWLQRGLFQTPRGYWDPLPEDAKLIELWEASQEPPRRLPGRRTA